MQTDVSDTSITVAQILAARPLNATGNVLVRAVNVKSDAEANAHGINAPGLAIGVSKASANANAEVFALITDTHVTAVGDVTLDAKFGTADMTGANADSYGSVGLLPAGNSLTASSTATEVVRVAAGLGYPELLYIPTTGQINAGVNVTIATDLITRASATANNSGNGVFFAVGDASAKAVTADFVNSFVGAKGQIKAGKALNMTSATTNSMKFYAAGDNGSTVALGNSVAAGKMQRRPAVTLGLETKVSADTISLLATVRNTEVTGSASWESKGLGGNALPTAKFELYGGSRVNVSAAATVDARVINLDATSNEDLRVTSYGDVQGLGGLIDGVAHIVTNELVSVEINPSAIVRGTQSVSLHAGYGRVIAETNVHEYLGTFAGTANVQSTLSLNGTVYLGARGANIITPSFTHSVTREIVRSVKATYTREGTPLKGGSVHTYADDNRTFVDEFGARTRGAGAGRDDDGFGEWGSGYHHKLDRDADGARFGRDEDDAGSLRRPAR